MTLKDDYKKGDEAEIVVDAVQAPQAGTGTGTTTSRPNEPPIPAGHSRFYCEKCHTPYDLPDRATSWRCAKCLTFNSTTPGECEWCTVL